MLISIITVNYNDAEGLEKTILSVSRQNYKNIEFIVVDGASTDNSPKVIKNNNLITNFIIERDKGIYDAMNKGIKLANGDFAIFMNSGDEFYSNDVLKNFVKSIKDIEKVYFGRAEIIFTDENKWLYPNDHYSNRNIEKWLHSNHPNHQAMFFPKSFYKKNFYNLVYKIAADSEYKLRSRKENGYSFLDFVVCRFYIGGASSNFKSFKRTWIIIKETWLIRRKYEGYYRTIKRCILILMKFILNSLFSNQKLYEVIKRYRK